MKKCIGILRGGEVDNYEESLKNGGDVFRCIHENLSEKWRPIDILIDRSGVWHADGIPIYEKADLIHKVDAIWNATHPSFSSTLETLKIPHFSVDSFAHAMLENRNMLRDHMKFIGVNMPRHIILPAFQSDFDGPREKYSIKKAKEIFERFGAPWIVKSLPENKNMGIHIANTFPELVAAIEDGVNQGKSILVEEFIVGKDIGVHTLAGFRNKEIYNFPIGNIEAEKKQKLEALSEEIFKHMGITHYLKSNFKIHPRGKIYFTGIELTPSFDSESELASTGEAVGAKSKHLIEHILERIIV